ncbi:phage portal protein [Peptoniphilus genitalis]|uniref:Phage portal protein n=1 Tax=Peptoniphilus genitalis TaxID=3036303 RepID=A0ABY4TKD9_9FIRM|nr:phage portal protein [Peptoniphilus sp. SAHP1]URN40895.1 phage portal protein [Peptoniphilus sp. SAHP1]
MNLELLNNEELVKYLESKLSGFEETKTKMQTGIDYYNYKQAIDDKKRAVIGKNGNLITIKNLPNTIIKDNQYSRALDQKRSYVLSKRPNINSKNKAAIDFLDGFIDNRFMRTLNKIAIDSYNTGYGWMYLYTDGKDIKYKRLDPMTVIPEWADDNHESLDAVIRVVSESEFEAAELKVKHYVYVYMLDGIKVFNYKDGKLAYLKDEQYLEKEGNLYSYKKLPFVYFKQPNEITLLDRIRCLQDALNLLLSNYADNMFENPMNSILVLKNYEGEDLGEFREKLAQYAAIKVRTADGSDGGVDTLQVTVNSDNYKVIIELIKKAIAHNARSLYLDNDRTSNAPNTLNIKAMYSDMELDANDLELEFTASFEYLFSWVADIVGIDFSDAEVKFKRSIMVNDESTIEMIRNSIGIISDETLVAAHPFVEDVSEEMKRIEKEKEKSLEYFDDYKNLGGEGHDQLLGSKDRKAE